MDLLLPRGVGIFVSGERVHCRMKLKTLLVLYNDGEEDDLEKGAIFQDEEEAWEEETWSVGEDEDEHLLDYEATRQSIGSLSSCAVRECGGL